MTGINEWLVIGAVVLLLFGGSRIPALFGAVGQGIRNFRQGLESDSAPSAHREVHSPPSPPRSDR